MGRYLGVFIDKVEIETDARLIEQLLRGKKYAAGLPQKEEEAKPEKPTEPEKMFSPEEVPQPDSVKRPL